MSDFGACTLKQLAIHEDAAGALRWLDANQVLVQLENREGYQQARRDLLGALLGKDGALTWAVSGELAPHLLPVAEALVGEGRAELAALLRELVATAKVARTTSAALSTRCDQAARALQGEATTEAGEHLRVGVLALKALQACATQPWNMPRDARALFTSMAKVPEAEWSPEAPQLFGRGVREDGEVIDRHWIDWMQRRVLAHLGDAA